MALELGPHPQKMAAGDVRHIVGKTVTLLFAAIERVVRTAEGESLHQGSRSSDVVAQSLRSRALIKKECGIGDTNRLVGDGQERVIQDSGVVQREITCPKLISQPLAKDVNVR